MERAIQVSDAVKAYPLGAGEVVAVDHLSLEIGRGEFVAVVGRSGSGKTTLLNLLAGIDRPTSGTVRVAGADLGRLSESGLAAWRGRNVGLVFQFFQLLPTLTVVENVMLPMDFAKKHPGRPTPRSGAAPARPGRHRRPGRQASRHAVRRPAAARRDRPGAGQRSASSCWPTSRPATSTPPPPTPSWSCSPSLNAEGRTIVVVTHERDIRSIVGREVTLVDGRIVTDESAPAGMSA